MHLRLILTLMAFGLVAACEAPEVTSAERTIEEISAVGTIREIDRVNRRFKLRINGRNLTLRANEAVAVFDILEVGDRVRVNYTESVAVTMADPDAPTPANVSVTEGLFVENRTVGRDAEAILTEELELVSYDPGTQTAVLRDDTGEVFSVSVPREMRAFARSRSPGDRIVITYVIGAALSLQLVET